MKLDLPDTIGEKKYSIIIPHKNSFHLLQRLLHSIPKSSDIQIIIVDDNSNNDEKEKLKSLKFDENLRIFFNTESGGAGKARNIALEHATGKWLLFSDADDFFCDNMLSVIEPYFNAEEDIIYFGTTSVYNDTTIPAYRHTRYLKLVTDFIESKENEDSLKYFFTPPWGKMYRRAFIEERKIRFEEILASNDMRFSITSAYYAQKIAATLDVLYTITVTQGSLTNSFNRELFNTKFLAALRINDFLRSINKPKYQQSVLYFLARSNSFGWKYMVFVLKNLLKHRSNMFIGMEKILRYRTILNKRENPALTQKK